MGLMPAIKKVTSEIVVLLLIFGFSADYYFEVSALPSRTINLLLIQPVFMVIAISTIALIFIMVRDALRSSATSVSVQSSPTKDVVAAALSDSSAGPVDPHFIKNGIAFGVCTLAYVLLLDRLGFISSSLLYLSILIYLLGGRSFWLTVVLPIAVVGFLYVTMSILLKFPLPQGFLI
uniref:tripartite tricarboxylate transporter TctB family protein n=1 Tax=Orrella sp. TaxID=1921583 RepID=UPI004047143F